MFNVTENVSVFVKEKGYRVSVLSEKTGISKNVLHNSLSGSRKLRADEYLTLCGFFEVAPEYFMKANENTEMS